MLWQRYCYLKVIVCYWVGFVVVAVAVIVVGVVVAVLVDLNGPNYFVAVAAVLVVVVLVVTMKFVAWDWAVVGHGSFAFADFD